MPSARGIPTKVGQDAMHDDWNRLQEMEPGRGKTFRPALPIAELIRYGDCRDEAGFEAAVRDLTSRLPFPTEFWPVFGDYREEHWAVDVTPWEYAFLYCERGHRDLRATERDFVGAFYQVVKLLAPPYTACAALLASQLHPLDHARSLRWLQSSSEIALHFQVNEAFGLRTACHNLLWMCEELVRTGLARDLGEAFGQQERLVHALRLGGMSRSMAQRLHNRLARR